MFRSAAATALPDSVQGSLSVGVDGFDRGLEGHEKGPPILIEGVRLAQQQMMTMLR